MLPALAMPEKAAAPLPELHRAAKTPPRSEAAFEQSLAQATRRGQSEAKAPSHEDASPAAAPENNETPTDEPIAAEVEALDAVPAAESEAVQTEAPADPVESESSEDPGVSANGDGQPVTAAPAPAAEQTQIIPAAPDPQQTQTAAVAQDESAPVVANVNKSAPAPAPAQAQASVAAVEASTSLAANAAPPAAAPPAAAVASAAPGAPAQLSPAPAIANPAPAEPITTTTAAQQIAAGAEQPAPKTGGDGATADSDQQEQAPSQQQNSGVAKVELASIDTAASASRAAQHAAADALPLPAVEGPSAAASPRAQAVTQTPTPAGAQPSAESADAQLNAGRLARGLQNALNQNGGTVTLRLTPADMGTVRIQLQIQAGSVNASFHTETESARNLLNQQFAQLRSALEGRGLSVERLTVQTMQNAGSSLLNQNNSQPGNGQGHSQSNSHADGAPHDGRSRGQYSEQNPGGSNQRDQQTPAQAAQRRAFERILNEVG